MRRTSELLTIVRDEFEKTQEHTRGLANGIVIEVTGAKVFVFGLCGFIADLYNADLIDAYEWTLLAKIFETHRPNDKTAHDYWWPPCTAFGREQIFGITVEDTKRPRIVFLNELIDKYADG